MDGTCKKYYGKNGTATSKTGIKIFKKTTSFNKFEDVTSSLDSVTANSGELTPFFVIYDCSDDACTQTSGFVRYGPVDDSEFVNCYTGSNINSSDELTAISSPIGCIKLNKNESHDSYCSNDGEGLKLAATGSYKFDGETFKMCTDIEIENTPTYKTQFISIPFGDEGVFYFISGKTPFPNTETRGKVLIKYSSNYAALARSKFNIFFFFILLKKNVYTYTYMYFFFFLNVEIILWWYLYNIVK